MPVHIKIREFLNVFQNRLKIFQISLPIVTPLKKIGVIRVAPVADVGGAYDEIKLMGLGKHRVLPHGLRLQPQLHAEKQAYPPGVLFLKARQVVQIGIRENKIIVLGKAQGI